MFSKIFISIILVTSVYTYMLKSIKNNNETDFQNLPENFDLELKEIQAVKPYLKMPNMNFIRSYLRMIFGSSLPRLLYGKWENDFKGYKEFFSEDILSKLKECKDNLEQKKIFDENIATKLKDFDAEAVTEIKNNFDGTVRWFHDPKILREYLDNLLGEFEKIL